MSMELWWNNADRERTQCTRRKTSPSANFSTTNAYVEKVQYIFYPTQNIKIKMYRTVILPVVLYGCQTWSLTSREEHRFSKTGSGEDIWV